METIFSPILESIDSYNNNGGMLLHSTSYLLRDTLTLHFKMSSPPKKKKNKKRKKKEISELQFDVFELHSPEVTVCINIDCWISSTGSDDLYVPQLDSEDSDDCSRSSCEHQACNMSDVYLSDMIFSGAPSGSDSQFDNRADTDFLPDYRFDESSLLCDLTEEYMALPFLGENLDTGHDFDGKPPQQNIDSDNSSLYMAIHQLKPCSQDSQLNTYSDQDYDCFDPQMYIRSLPDQPDVAFSLLPTRVSNEKQSKQITLVLDLDGKYIIVQFVG